MAAQGSAPRYIVEGHLAEGGMGTVSVGTMVTPAGRRRVAIKRLRADREGGPLSRDRLATEARLVFRFTHANICQVLDLAEDEDGDLFVVMEYVQGMDLGQLLSRLRERGRRLEPPMALYVAREAAQALDYAHRQTDDDGYPLGLIHGDVTPGNILLSTEGETKLTDFGIARALSGASPGAGLRGGTPGFVAPETLHGACDQRADIYSLGVTLAVALAGVEAHAARTALGRSGEPEPGGPEVGRIVARMTEPSPADRFLAAHEVERALSLELARRYPAFTPADLGGLVRTERRPDAAPTGARARTLVSIATEPPPDRAAPTRLLVGARTHTVPRPARRRPRAWATLLGATLAAAGVLLAGRAALRTATPAGGATSSDGSAPVAASAASAASADGAASAASADGGPAHAVATPDPRPPDAGPRPTPDPPPTSTPGRRDRHREAEPAAAQLTVNSQPWGAVYIDGRQVASETPLYRHRLPAGRHQVRILYPDSGRYSATKIVVLRPGERRTVGFER